MKGFKIFSAIAAIISLIACSDITGPQYPQVPEQGECLHNWKDGVCNECGKTCTHNWVGNTCVICGKECNHNLDENGICEGCGAPLKFMLNPWHLKSFCGAPVDVDLYMKFNSDGSFLILQRSGSKGYAEYRGTYSLDVENSILSGFYSDGVNWACSYRVSINSDNELVLESITENPEVSVYEAAEMPSTTTSQVKVCGIEVQDVRPL